jgi:L-lactate dehydrogenase complex protein LldG
MSREAFLTRVRTATAAGRAYRVEVGDVLNEPMPYCGAGDDKLARMAAEVAAVGGHSHPVETLAEAHAILGQLLNQYQCRSALCWQHPILERLGLAELLTSSGVAHLDYDHLSALPVQDRQGVMLAADIGISSATYAVAETGTLVMASAPGRERSASLLPPVHVAIVEADQILPDLFDLFNRLTASGAGQLPTNLTLITGPSKTGDLELKLTTGVHGPANWHVIIVRNGR